MRSEAVGEAEADDRIGLEVVHVVLRLALLRREVALEGGVAGDRTRGGQVHRGAPLQQRAYVELYAEAGGFGAEGAPADAHVGHPGLEADVAGEGAQLRAAVGVAVDGVARLRRGYR